MKGNKGGECHFKHQLCQENWCEECWIYAEHRTGKLPPKKEAQTSQEERLAKTC